MHPREGCVRRFNQERYFVGTPNNITRERTTRGTHIIYVKFFR